MGMPSLKAVPRPPASREPDPEDIVTNEALDEFVRGLDLVCLYTGEKLKLRFDDDLRHPGYYFEGGFDPSLPFMTLIEGTRALLMRGGKPHAAVRMACPYSGAPLRMLEDEKGMWRVTGEFFSPGIRWDFKEDAVYAALHRDGVPPSDRKPHARINVTHKPDGPVSDPTEGLGGDPGGVLQEAMDKVLAEGQRTK